MAIGCYKLIAGVVLAITLRIPEDLQKEMDEFKEVSWSAVALQGIRDYIEKRKKAEGE
ncbi:hypothetical protein LCGC14_1734400 [marine sediment metagenome]|uniref:Ribbon-helix-helix protein CopG domain-containing protein n=1 Tax=marine sediment metagenome TaxID=412755 RepID=A0A0F9HWB9_9ZZZZ